MIWHSISDDEWGEALAAARRAEERWARSPQADRNWNEYRHLLGQLGERFVADLLDLPWDPNRAGSGPDGGVDFGDTDVKCYRHTARELQRAVSAPTWATWFLVVLVNLETRDRAVAGHTHVSELKAAPVRNYGHGPVLCLPLSELAEGLPPHLVIDAHRRRS